MLAGFNSASSTTGQGRPQLRTLIRDVLVLKTPNGGTSSGANNTQNLTVRVTAGQAAQLAFAADNGKVWFILRPPAGARDNRPSAVTLDSLLAGTPTIEVGR